MMNHIKGIRQTRESDGGELLLECTPFQRKSLFLINWPECLISEKEQAKKTEEKIL